MHPLFIIARREFLQRVRQKSFWILLLLGPIFLLFVMVVPIGLAMKKENASEILYLDESGELDDFMYSDKKVGLVKIGGTVEQAYKTAKTKGYAGLLSLHKDSVRWQCRFYPTGLQGQSVELLRLAIQQRIYEYELENKRNIELPRVSFREASMAELEKGNTDMSAAFVAGLFMAVLVLVFINQYAHMVLRGIVEEKQNRISELILTSIKPMHFITGKIVGIASVAFLQMAIWLALSGLISTSIYRSFKLERFTNAQLEQTLQKTQDIQQTLEMNSILNSIDSVQLSVLLAGFLFYFVFGYLLFSALFAVVGVAVGSDTDAQQMAIPFTFPLAIPVIMLQYITDNPEAGLVKFLSIFPLTAPTTMLLRLPFGVAWWEFLLSAIVLIFSFLGAAYTASKVYRIGIFMYGKRFGFREVWKMVGRA